MKRSLIFLMVLFTPALSYSFIKELVDTVNKYPWQKLQYQQIKVEIKVSWEENEFTESVERIASDRQTTMVRVISPSSDSRNEEWKQYQDTIYSKCLTKDPNAQGNLIWHKSNIFQS